MKNVVPSVGVLDNGITASRHVLNMTPNRSYTYNALLFRHSIHIIGIMQCHTTMTF